MGLSSDFCLKNCVIFCKNNAAHFWAVVMCVGIHPGNVMGSSTTDRISTGHRGCMFMGRMLRFGHLAVVLSLGVACTDPGDHPPGLETMTEILAEMVRANQGRLPPDSMRVKREAVFEKHGTNEQEVRDWIAAMRKDPAENQKVAIRVAELIGNKSVPGPPTYRERRRTAPK